MVLFLSLNLLGDKFNIGYIGMAIITPYFLPSFATYPFDLKSSFLSANEDPRFME
jgi:hypothetical protein